MPWCGRVKGGRPNGCMACRILRAGGFDACDFPGTGAGAVDNIRGKKPSNRMCLCARDGTAGNFPIGSSAAYEEECLSFPWAPNSECLGGRCLYSFGETDLGRLRLSGEAGPSLDSGK